MKLTASMMVIVLGIGFLAWKLCFPRGGIPTVVPALEQQWDEQIYGLDEHEVIRFFWPVMKVRRGRSVDPPINFAPPEETHCVFEVGPRETDSIGQSGGPDSVRTAINWCAKLSELDFEVPKDIPGLPAYGDWLIRDRTPTQRLMPALQSALSAIAGRQFIIECSVVDREVIVVSGKWNFREANPDPNFSYTAAPGTLLRHVNRGALDESFQSLEEKIHYKIISEIDGPQSRQVRWTSGGYLGYREIDAVLSTLEAQTSLKFTRTHRRIPIWLLREQSATTQASK